MTKLYEVSIVDGSSEFINLDKIQRLIPGGDSTSIVIGNETIEVQTHTLMSAFHAAEVGVMSMQREEPVVEEVGE